MSAEAVLVPLPRGGTTVWVSPPVGGRSPSPPVEVVPTTSGRPLKYLCPVLCTLQTR